MSSFIVEDKTINRILSFLSYHNTSSVNDMQIKYWIEKQKIDTSDEVSKTQFGRKLFELNLDAVNQRYTAKTSADFIEEFNYSYVYTKIEQVYKSLCCFTYQCNEGNVPNCKLYKAMEKLEDILAHMIANREADKIKAEWA